MTLIEDSNPYPWPFQGSLAPRGICLVVLAAQRTLVDVSHDAARVMAAVNRTAVEVRRLGGSVVWVRHRQPEERKPRPIRRPKTLLPAGAIWHPWVRVHSSDTVVDCFGWDGCFGSPLDVVTRGAHALALCGFASELTVDSTVRSLNDRGHECIVLTDACAPLDETLGRHAHASLTMSGGIFGALGTSTSLIAALERAADPSGVAS